jgi:hypothetical protein
MLNVDVNMSLQGGDLPIIIEQYKIQYDYPRVFLHLYIGENIGLGHFPPLEANAPISK